MWASLMAQLVKNLPAMRETWVQSLGWEDPTITSITKTSSSVQFSSVAQSCPTLCNPRNWGSSPSSAGLLCDPRQIGKLL